MAFNAYQVGVLTDGTNIAGADYSSATAQYRLVRLTTEHTIKYTTVVTQVPYGVLMNRPSSGESAAVAVGGVVPIRITTTAHSAIAVGSKIGISTAAAGSGGLSTALTRYVIGRSKSVLAANTTGIITVHLTFEGSGSTGAGTAP